VGEWGGEGEQARNPGKPRVPGNAEFPGLSHHAWQPSCASFGRSKAKQPQMTSAYLPFASSGCLCLSVG